LDTCKPEIADFEIAILVDEDIAGFEVSVDNASGMNIF
jgi:hypothetical protein